MGRCEGAIILVPGVVGLVMSMYWKWDCFCRISLHLECLSWIFICLWVMGLCNRVCMPHRWRQLVL
jgi:hypothetical protein